MTDKEWLEKGYTQSELDAYHRTGVTPDKQRGKVTPKTPISGVSPINTFTNYMSKTTDPYSAASEISAQESRNARQNQGLGPTWLMNAASGIVPPVTPPAQTAPPVMGGGVPAFIPRAKATGGKIDYNALKGLLGQMAIPEMGKYKDPQIKDFLQAFLAGTVGQESAYSKRRGAFEQSEKEKQARAMQENIRAQEQQQQDFQNKLAIEQINQASNRESSDVDYKNQLMQYQAGRDKIDDEIRRAQVNQQMKDDMLAQWAALAGIGK